MHRWARPVFTLLLSLIVASLSAQSPDRGAVSGRVTLTKRVRGTALPSTAYPARTIGRHDAAPIPEISNVVVYVKDPGYHGPLPVRRVELRQQHETFVPRLAAVTIGSTVDFPNDDPFFHNVFSLSSAATFNLGRYPRGRTRSQTFTKPGVVKVYCQIHSHMSATILVLDHPFFTVPNQDGTYRLPLLPPGEYTIVGWHERAGERMVRVRVQPGQAAIVDLALPVEESP